MLRNLTRDETARCICCDDPARFFVKPEAPNKYAGKYLCKGCALELFAGILPKIGHRHLSGHAGRRDETGPSWDDAVRVFEGE